jgi:hypothetical protein
MSVRFAGGTERFAVGSALLLATSSPLAEDSMIRCDVWIQGTSPLLQNRFPDPLLDPPVGDDETPEAGVWRRAHFDDDGFLCFPSVAVSLLLRQASEDAGIRLTTRDLVVSRDMIPLFAPDRTTRIEDFETDARAVRCPHGVRSICYRPRIDAWAAPISLLVNEKQVSPAFVRRMLIDGGQWVGLGDFRPQCGGSFGRFEVVRWNETPQQPNIKTDHQVSTWEAPV